MKFIVLFLSLVSLNALAQESCYSSAPQKVRSGADQYTITFNKEMKLQQNKSGNYSARVTANRNFGCIVFSVVPTLSGEFKAAGGQYLKAQCSGKNDFAFMQFVNAEGKKVFRIQCEEAAYEEETSQKFVPGSVDAQTLLKDIVTVK